jgi:hypothetical protein
LTPARVGPIAQEYIGARTILHREAASLGEVLRNAHDESEATLVSFSGTIDTATPAISRRWLTCSLVQVIGFQCAVDVMRAQRVQPLRCALTS